MSLVVFLTVLIYVTIANGNDHYSKRVIDGDESKPHSHPGIVLLEIKGMGLCGGTILPVPCMKDRSNLILTAAHCLTSSKHTECSGSDIPKIRVKAGKHDITEDERGDETRMVIKAACHPGYKFIDVVNDIAIVKLDKTIQFSKTIKPITLPKYWKSIPSNLSCIAAGWGITSMEWAMEKDGWMVSPGLPDQLHELQMRTVDDHICKTMYLKYFDARSMLCATRKDSINFGATCSGDSGGPLFCKEGNQIVQEGIVSWGYQGCPAPSDVYTRVRSFVPWIEKTAIKMACD